jgi:hypothetical protein
MGAGGGGSGGMGMGGGGRGGAGTGGGGSGSGGGGGAGGGPVGCGNVQPWVLNHPYALNDTASNVCRDNLPQQPCMTGRTYVWTCIWDSCSVNPPGVADSWAIWKVGMQCN